MTQTENRKDFDLDRLLHPAGAFRTPVEVVNDPDLTIQEKRAILASWASDACAVEAAPDLRQPTGSAPVRFDDIMDALKRLDGQVAEQPTYGKFINRARRLKELYRPTRSGRSPFPEARKEKWVKLEELRLRQPGTRRILESMKLIEEEQPGLIEQASLAAQTKSADVGGGVPQ